MADNAYAGAKIGGRVRSVTGNDVTLDREVEIVGGESYQLAYVNSNSQTARLTVTEQLSADTLRLSAVPEGIEALGVWTLTSTDLSTRLFRCMAISETETGYSISALEHVPEKHAIIEEGIQFEKSTGTYYSRVPQIVRLQADMEPDSSSVRMVWELSASSMNVDIELQLLRDGKLLRSDTVNDTEITYNALSVGSYTVSARAVNAAGQKGNETQAVFTITLPATPAEIVFIEDNTIISARPDVETQPLGTEYDWFWGETQEQAEGLTQYLGRAFTMTHNALTPDTEYWYAVQAVNALGRSDVVVSSAKTTLNADDILTIIQNQITQEHLNDELNQFLAQVDTRSQASATVIEHMQGSVVDVQRVQNGLNQSVFNLASDIQNTRDEYERRLLEGESLIGAVVYRDADTGQIINKAYNYADQKYSEAGLLIDGVKATVTINAKQLQRVETETGDRLTEAEASISINAGKIESKASYSEVTEIVSGAIDAITPAYSWHFNTSNEGWTGATWNADGTITATALSKTGISFDADENPVVRLRLKGSAAGSLSWNGQSQNVVISAPSQSDEYETQLITLSANDGWTGTITSIELALDAQIDFIEIGKSSANELQLQDVTSRVTEVEEELDPENTRWSVYLTQTYWDANKLTTSDVQTEIDGWDAEWSVTASLAEITDNDTITKANSAQSWINAAESNITSVVTAYNALPGGVDETLSEQGTQLSTAQQRLDAAEGNITDTVSSVTDLNNVLGTFNGDINELLNAYNEFLSEGDYQQDKISLAYAEQTLQAHSDELSAIATSVTELEASVSDGDQAALALALSYTKAAVGYCIDANGNITGHDDAVLCVAAGNSWVDGPLAEFIRNLSVSLSDGSQASVNQLAQAFIDKDGNPVARGGITTDVNGKISGFVNTNDGEDSALDFIADHTRIGVLDENGNFTPLFYLDAESGLLTFNGQMILGDGYSVTGEDSIRALDGADGDTIYTEFQFSSDASSWHFPEQSGDRYMRTRTVTNGTPGSWGTVADLKGATGATGPTGASGQDATERYTWIKYADDAAGSGLSDSSTGKKYIGIAYNKTSATESTNPAYYTWSLIKGDTGATGAQGPQGATGATGAKGDTGDTGADGQDGSAGAGFYTLTLRSGVFPSDSLASADFVSAYGRNPVLDDHLTYRNADGTASSTKRYNGSGWVAPIMLIHGDLLATGTVTGDRFKAGTEITAPVVSGGQFNGGSGNFGVGGPHNGYYTQITDDGTVRTNKLEATGGTITDLTASNVVIDASCEVQGPLKAAQIVGDIYINVDVVKAVEFNFLVNSSTSQNFYKVGEFDIDSANIDRIMSVPVIDWSTPPPSCAVQVIIKWEDANGVEQTESCLRDTLSNEGETVLIDLPAEYGDRTITFSLWLGAAIGGSTTSFTARYYPQTLHIGLYKNRIINI